MTSICPDQQQKMNGETNATRSPSSSFVSKPFSFSLKWPLTRIRAYAMVRSPTGFFDHVPGSSSGVGAQPVWVASSSVSAISISWSCGYSSNSSSRNARNVSPSKVNSNS